VANIDVSSQGLVTLVLKNAGRSVAADVRLSLDKDFFRLGEKQNLKDLPVFSGHAFGMGPHDSIRIALGVARTLYRVAELTPPRFNITASYRSNTTKYQETLPVDLTPYYETTVPKSEFAIEMEKLRRVLEKRR
jgi:hypothetical protein